jgi:hypothetical protein
MSLGVAGIPLVFESFGASNYSLASGVILGGLSRAKFRDAKATAPFLDGSIRTFATMMACRRFRQTISVDLRRRDPFAKVAIYFRDPPSLARPFRMQRNAF